MNFDNEDLEKMAENMAKYIEAEHFLETISAKDYPFLSPDELRKHTEMLKKAFGIYKEKVNTLVGSRAEKNGRYVPVSTSEIEKIMDDVIKEIAQNKEQENTLNAFFDVVFGALVQTGFNFQQSNKIVEDLVLK